LNSFVRTTFFHATLRSRGHFAIATSGPSIEIITNPCSGTSLRLLSYNDPPHGLLQRTEQFSTESWFITAAPPYQPQKSVGLKKYKNEVTASTTGFA